MQSDVFRIKSRVWLYPGMSGWHFISISKEVSKKIREKFAPVIKRGWGSIPVRVTIGNTSWETSIFPEKKTQTYLLPLKASVRKQEKILHDDIVSCSIQIRK